MSRNRTLSKVLSKAALIAFLSIPCVSISNAQSSGNLSELNGENGFLINGIDATDRAGEAVASGDINGDGFADIIIGAYGADSSATVFIGEVYVVFGSDGNFAQEVELSELNGTNGFVVVGLDNGDRLGEAVASGDINGDGIDDLVLGAPLADTDKSNSGEVYVIYGGASLGSGGIVRLSELNGNNGYTIKGFNGRQTGNTIATGDINGDGSEDIILGAYYAQPNGFESGQTYILYGGGAVGAGGEIELSDLDGNNGFMVNGDTLDIQSGYDVASGDINGDGIDDVIIGAKGASPNGVAKSGQTHVIFGSSTPIQSPIQLDTLSGAIGFSINGIQLDDQSGYSVSSGDINGDGIEDVLIGAYQADRNGGNSGEVYVVYGMSESRPHLNMEDLDQSTGFVLIGAYGTFEAGRDVASGDINGDGIEDVILSGVTASTNGNSNTGAVVVFYGSDGSIPIEIELSDLNGTDGYGLNGINAFDYIGDALASGDVNGDGKEDVIIGGQNPSPNGPASGQTYVVFERILPASTVSNENTKDSPHIYSLGQNYPNPFNPSTSITYSLAENGLVSLEVFDMLGRKLAILIDGKMQTSGIYTQSFDASSLSSGMYIYRLKAGGFTQTRKMLLVK